MIKAVIFDLDGTTLNTIDDIQNSLNIVLNKHNIESTTHEKVRLALGMGSKYLVKKHLPESLNDRILNKITDEYIETYKKYYNIKTKPYDGIYKLLEELQNKEKILAINSNKPDELCKKLIIDHFPKINFKFIIGSREDIPNKPDPYSVNEIIEKINIDRKEVLYVGDSENDILTAKNAGIKSVGCLWGFRDLKTLVETNADYIISSPKELLEYID